MQDIHYQTELTADHRVLIVCMINYILNLPAFASEHILDQL